MSGSGRREGITSLIGHGWQAYWAFVALLLLASYCDFLPQPGSPKSTIQLSHTDGKEQEASKGEPRNSAPSIAPVEAVAPKVQSPIPSNNSATSQQKKYNKIRDLKAQESMALWTKIMGIAAIFTTLITAFGLWLLGRTLHATQRAAIAAEEMVGEAKSTTIAAIDTANIAKQQMVADLRPYAYVDDAWIEEASEWEVKNKSSGAMRHTHKLCVRVKNVGRAPALNCSVDSNIYFGGGILSQGAHFGEIFPDEEREEIVTTFKIGSDFGQWLEGELRYSSIRDSHFTKFRFEIKPLADEHGSLLDYPKKFTLTKCRTRFEIGAT